MARVSKYLQFVSQGYFFPWPSQSICLLCFNADIVGMIYRIKKWLGDVVYRLSVLMGIVVVAVSLVIIFGQLGEIREKFAAMYGEMEKEEVALEEPERGWIAKKEDFFPIKEVILPVYTDAYSSKKVVIDLQIVSSNPRIKEYFWDSYNTHLIYDRLNSTLEPVTLEFPLEEEGKRIIREKIRDELNQLTKELELGGEIEKVYIDHIISG